MAAADKPPEEMALRVEGVCQYEAVVVERGVSAQRHSRGRVVAVVATALLGAVLLSAAAHSSAGVSGKVAVCLYLRDDASCMSVFFVYLCTRVWPIGDTPAHSPGLMPRSREGALPHTRPLPQALVGRVIVQSVM